LPCRSEFTIHLTEGEKVGEGKGEKPGVEAKLRQTRIRWGLARYFWERVPTPTPPTTQPPEERVIGKKTVR